MAEKRKDKARTVLKTGLLAIADEVTKVHAICVKCGNLVSMRYVH